MFYYSDPQPTNVTVIQVSNKGPPHTAIPVMGPETDIFDFSFHQNSEPAFVNIVNTEVNVNNENGYGTVFSKESDYGHLSLTTTVNVSKTDVNMDTAVPDDMARVTMSSTTLPGATTSSATISSATMSGATTSSATMPGATMSSVKVTDNNGVYEQLCMASTSNETPVSRVKNQDRLRKSSLPNLDVASNPESTYECLFPSEDNNRNATVTVNNETNGHIEVNSNSDIVHSEVVQVNQVNLSTSSRVLRSNVERSHSQNAYDSVRMRENAFRRGQNNSPKREGRNGKFKPQNLRYLKNRIIKDKTNI
jgi:hypothetical protein